jgi:hypothetical protein
MYKRVLMVLLALVMVFGFATASQAAPWKDKNQKKFFQKKNWKPVTLVDISSHWAQTPIQTMASYGIILGYGDGTFRPDAAVSNNEAIMMISRAAGFEVTTTKPGDSGYDGFPYWMQDCIDFALDEGIVTEDELEDLKGNKAAKRYQVAVWAARAMGLEVDDRLTFADSNEIPFYARPYVGGMCANRFMIGYPGNIFQPNKAVSRAELAMVLYRILLAQDNNDNTDDYSVDLKVEKLNPKDGSDSVDPDTNKLTVKFNENIRAVDDLDDVMDGITVRNITDGEYVDIDKVTISGSTLTIKLEDALEYNKTYRVTIEPGIIETEDSGDSFEGLRGSDWQFTTIDSFYIEELTPENGDTGVSPTSVLEARFSGDISVISGKSLLRAVSVYNKTADEQVDVDKVEIDGDTLVITLEDTLEEDSTFEVTIKGGYLEDEDTGVDFAGLNGSDWTFTTR